MLDSQTGAGGLGCLVIVAASVAEAGGALDDVVDAVRQARESLDIWFCLDTLEYLRRGGRIGAAQAMVGTALKVKPILTFGTEIAPVGRVRTHRRAFERMVEYLRELHDRGASDWVVQHAQAPADAERLVAEGTAIFGSGPLFCTEVGPVLGAHLGAGMLVGGMTRPALPARPAGGSASRRAERPAPPRRDGPSRRGALYLVILMIRSMPRRVWGRLSWVSMKHTCTYQPGLAVIVSCW